MIYKSRFAPSPTGYLHIGGARTALYSYLYARHKKGSLVLRIEDTDQERSKAEYEKILLDELRWIGIEWEEGPDTKNQELGPYRQSERLSIYKKYVDQLLEEGKAFYCFCTEAELEAMKEKALAAGKDPIYDGTYRDLPIAQARERIAQGEKAVVRLIAKQKAYSLRDHVRDDVTFPPNMVGDFVIMRSDGFPVYNFSCVVDDCLMRISHVIRGDEHLNNTLRQMMIAEALEFTLPEYAHVSLLIGKDKQKLSKRHGATSLEQYREKGYLPQAVANYLCLLGWSHPDGKDIFSLEEAAERFSLDRFSKSPSMVDIEKLNFINSEYLKALDETQYLELAQTYLEREKLLTERDPDWRKSFLLLIREKIQVFDQILAEYDDIFGVEDFGDDIKEVTSWETTSEIKKYLTNEIQTLIDEKQGTLSNDKISQWMDFLKKEKKIKGKNLFMGMRVVLTNKTHGPDLKGVLCLNSLEGLLKNIQRIS